MRPRVETERALPQHERAAASGDQQLIQREHFGTEQRDENLGALVVDDRRGVPQSKQQRRERSLASRILGSSCAICCRASAKGSGSALLHEWRAGACRQRRRATHGSDGALGGQGVGVCRNEHQDAAVERSDRHARAEGGERGTARGEHFPLLTA